MSTEMLDYRFSHAGNGSWSDGYDDKLFSPGSYDFHVWQQEKHLITHLIGKWVHWRDRYLDFACGTGRILTHVEDHFSLSVGLDISLTMLTQAHSKVKNAILVCGDATRFPELLSGTFDCITAWRFFLNAQPQLREEAMAFLASKLNSTESVLMFNVHGNRYSSRWLMVAVNHLRGRNNNTMSYSEVQELIERHGLEIVDCHGVNFLDKAFFNYMPRKLWSLIENASSRFNCLRKFSVYLVFVCRKRKQCI
ncbi:MAG: class I SAM-dependent DNA methyltransferase [Candidatus Binatia bacterium]